MTKTKSITRNPNHDDNASSVKRVKNSGVGPWSDCYYQALYLVMMQLGFFDYLSFGGVCKSWRSVAITNRKTFMASIPPMLMSISWRSFKKPCYLQDSEGKKFKTILPRFPGGTCVGLTGGYLIFFNRKNRDFRLVNPITRHTLDFPDFPTDYNYPSALDIRAILVFSRSEREWVFLVMRNCTNQIWFSIAGTDEWDYILCDSVISDLRAFKGKIYTLNVGSGSHLCDHLCEFVLDPEPDLTLLETKNSLSRARSPQLVSSRDNFYVMDRVWPSKNDPNPKDRYRFQELDLGEMKWVSREKRIGESGSFLSNFKHGVVVEPEFLGVRGEGLLQGHNTGEMLKLMQVEKPISSSFSANMWYLPHECFDVDYVDG